MTARTRLAAALVLAATLVALFAGCSDNSSEPANPAWVEMALPALGEEYGLIGVAAGGSRVMACGTTKNLGPVVLERASGAWEPVAAAAAALGGGPLMDVAFDAQNRGALVGADASMNPVVVVERNGWGVIAGPSTPGGLRAVAGGGGDTLRAVGMADGGIDALSANGAAWTWGRAGYTSPQEVGLEDLCYAHGVFYACGWNDGGPPYRVVRRNAGAGWEDVPGPTITTTLNQGVEYRAVMMDTGGVLWLGGGVEDYGVSPSTFTAILSRRTTNGEWHSVVLPDPDTVEAVNVILQTASGDIYLGCGDETARILRWDGSRWVDEGPGFAGMILDLAEGPDGMLYAVGWKGTEDTTVIPLILEKKL